MNDWTDEDWRLIGRMAAGERMETSEHERIRCLIEEDCGPVVDKYTDWHRGYCQCLLAARKRQPAIVRSITWGFGVNEPSQP